MLDDAPAAVSATSVATPTRVADRLGSAGGSGRPRSVRVPAQGPCSRTGAGQGRPLSERRGWGHGGRVRWGLNRDARPTALLVSLLLHTLLLLLLAAWRLQTNRTPSERLATVVSLSPAPPPSTVSVAFSAPDRLSSNQPPVRDAKPARLASALAAASLELVSTTFSPPTADETVATDEAVWQQVGRVLSRLEQRPAGAGPDAGRPDGRTLARFGGVAAGTPKQQTAEGEVAPAAGASQRLGSGASTGEGFFGVRLSARRVAFVLDASRSMNYPHPGPARTRLGRVKLEVLKSLQSLPADGRFFVVFFNEHPLVPPASGWWPASAQAARQCAAWLAQVKADGSTDPREALRLALSLRPEVVCLLSDGLFAKEVSEELLRAVPAGVVVHTFSFQPDVDPELAEAKALVASGRLDEARRKYRRSVVRKAVELAEAERVLRTLAERTGGQFHWLH